MEPLTGGTVQKRRASMAAFISPGIGLGGPTSEDMSMARYFITTGMAAKPDLVTAPNIIEAVTAYIEKNPLSSGAAASLFVIEWRRCFDGAEKKSGFALLDLYREKFGERYPLGAYIYLTPEDYISLSAKVRKVRPWDYL